MRATRMFILPVCCVLVLAGCSRSRSGDAEVAKAQADAKAPKREFARVTAESNSPNAEMENVNTSTAENKGADRDRRAADWVLRVDGSVRVLVDGVSHHLKKGDKLPDGPLKLLAIDLCNCPKATDEGRDYLRGLRGLEELTINDGAGIRNLDFLADMTSLQALKSEGMLPLVTDNALVRIKGMTNLKRLIIVSQAKNNSDLTDNVFAVVKELKRLEHLRLCHCDITDDGVRLLEGHGSLRSVDFWRTKIGDAGLLSLATLPKLENVSVSEKLVTDIGVKAFRFKLPKWAIHLSEKKK